MNDTAKNMFHYYRELHNKMKLNDTVIDKSGVKIVEIISPRIVLDPSKDNGCIDFNARKSPRDYLKKESEWYNSKSLSIEKVNDVKIWASVCDKNEEINSNYGYLVYSKGNFNQFDNVVKKLVEHKESRQAVIYYGRPTIHYEWNSFGSSDFICTLYQQFLIRNDELTTITSMRSCDFIFGAFNDVPFFTSVIINLYNNLLPYYPDLKLGEHIFIPNSAHVYERHFNLLDDIIQKETE